MTGRQGVFMISLDFELYWGVRDAFPLERYRANLQGVRTVVPLLLDLFARYEIHATWATVGFLFFETKEALLAGLPSTRPQYRNVRLSPYADLDKIGNNERDDPFHYAPSLIRRIASHPNQEIASHTFSHYYCLESGQGLADFRADLQAAQTAAQMHGLTLRSLVFPRNQFNPAYVSVCEELGFSAYRGNPAAWMYRPRNGSETPLSARALRLADAYVNLAPHLCHDIPQIATHSSPCDIPASRFLRPVSTHFAAFEALRLRRILGEMTQAAQTGRLYHLWWHPHNFGADILSNFAFLTSILDHYRRLQATYGMESRTMGELAAVLRDDRVREETHAHFVAAYP